MNPDFILLRQGILMSTLSTLGGMSVDYLEIAPNTHTPANFHRLSNEVLYIIEGELDLLIRDERRLMRKGDCVDIPIGTIHGSDNRSEGKVCMLAICVPPFDPSDQHFVGSDTIEIDHLSPFGIAGSLDGISRLGEVVHSEVKRTSCENVTDSKTADQSQGL
jgi:mannose-6-phosphate isomerase-like protein (cupin superfamily)